MPRLPQPGSDNGTWGDILNQYLSQAHDTNGNLKSGSVGSTQLQSNAVTASALAPNSVTNNAIAPNTITTAAIAPGSITTTELQNSSVSPTKLAATGTASGTTFLRGDGTWATPPGAGGGISNVVDDPSPQLGGNLDLNSRTVGDATAGDLTKLHAVTASSTELNYVTGVTSSIQTQLNSKQAAGSYATTTDLTTGLAGKANTSHTHTASQISDATATGRSVLMAADATAARIAIGAGTGNSNLTLAGSGSASTASHSDHTHSYTKSDVGLSNVDNTSDTNKPISTATQTALNGKAATTTTITGATSLTGGGDLSTSRTLSLVGDNATPGNSKYYGTNGSGTKGYHDLPAGGGGGSIASTDITDSTTVGRAVLTAADAGDARATLGTSRYLGAVADQTAMLTLTGNIGDWCLRSDLNSVFVLTALPATTAGNWTQPDPDLPAKVHAATAKSTLADGDELAIVDSESGNTLKKVTWDTIGAVLLDNATFGNALWGREAYFYRYATRMAVNVSSAALDMGTFDDEIPGFHVFTGSTARTWTLPPIGDDVGLSLRFKNRSSVNLTISRAGSDQIYNTAAVSTVTVAAGGSLTLVNDGTYWVTN